MDRSPILKEFALQPEAFESAQDVREAMGKFAFAEGRLICEVPEGWKDAVRRTLDRFPDIEAARAKRHLERLIEDGLVPARSKFHGDDSKLWVEHVVRSVNVQELDGGIVRRGGDTRLTNFDEFFANCPSAREGQIRTTIDGYRLLCRRLIELGPKVVVVDPYFGLHDIAAKRRVLLKELIQIGLAEKCSHFEIFSSKERTLEKITPDMFDKNVADALGAFHNPRLEVDFTVIDPSYAWERQHDRYLITARGAIDIRIGFELTSKFREAVVSMVDREPHEELCRKWLDGGHGFNIAHQVRWSQGSVRVLVDGRKNTVQV